MRARGLIARVFGRGTNDEAPAVAREQLLDTIADPLFVVDGSRAVLDMNAAAVRLAGSPERWRGASVDALFPFLNGAAIAGASAATAFEIDTGDLAYDVRVARVRASRGAWLVMLRDVTERRRLAAERERFVTRNSELVARISHELRTPIAAIQGSLQLVLGTARTSLDGNALGLVLLSEDVDLAVLDLQMPRRTGQDVISELRNGERHPDLPVVVLTGSLDQRQPHALGADVLLTKPTDLRRLVTEVRSLLERS